MEELIPIILFLVTGLVIITWIYFRSKEKQMIIDKGISYEQMQEFFKIRRDKYLFFKLGIVIFFFGLGLGVGLLLQSFYWDNIIQRAWVPFMTITMTGIGFIVAFLWTKKLEENERQNL